MLNKSHLLKPKEFWKYDWQLVVAVFLLCTGGLAFLASSLNIQPEDYWQELAKQLVIGLGVGGLITFGLARTDYHFLTKHRQKIAAFTLVLLGFVALFAAMVWFVKGPVDKVNFIRKFNWCC
jgi:cell division protein FtsW (lipid II flippase)